MKAEQVDRIFKKINQIIEEKKAVDELNQQVQQEKRDLVLKLNETESQLAEVEEQLRSLKVAHRMLETSSVAPVGEHAPASNENLSTTIDNKELKIKIDHYIKEIDKCIATLNN